MPRRAQVKVSLPPRLAHLLARICEATGRPPSQVVRRLLARYLPESASKLGIEDDWDRVHDRAVKALPSYLSRRSVERYLEKVYGDEKE